MQKGRYGITSSWQPVRHHEGRLASVEANLKERRGRGMAEELEFAGSTVGEKFCIALHNDFIEIEVDDPAEGIAISIKRADAIALAHAILRRYPTPDGSVLGGPSDPARVGDDS